MIQKRRSNKPRVSNTKSYFTETKTLPNYKEHEVLRQFITERGKILPRSRTGLTLKQQRLLAQAIKRARYLARLSYVSIVG